MTVEEAIEALWEFRLDADLLICGHEFDGLHLGGWKVTHFEQTDDKKHVLVEGAYPVEDI